MTEAEWLACDDPRPMIELLQRSGKASARKLRLFTCFCVRRFDEVVVGDDGVSLAIELAESFADGGTSPRELEKVRREVLDGCEPCSSAEVRYQLADIATSNPLRDVAPAATAFIFWLECNVDEEEIEGEVHREHAAMIARLRELVGNPFRPATLDRARLPPTVTSLAQAAYDERQLPSGELDPQRLAVLADALEEARADAALAAHLRSPGTHVRGCWALDAVLGLS